MKKLFYLLVLTISFNIYAQDWNWVNPLPQGNKLNDIQFVNDNFVTAVGDFGTFIKSENVGQTWSYQHLLYGNLNCLYFYSTLDGYIGGVNGLILKTNDGGKTWNTINSNINESIIDIYYQITNSTLLVLTNTRILRKPDNSTTWQTVATGFFSQFDFPDDSIGWICGTKIMKSINGGLREPTISAMAFNKNGAGLGVGTPYERQIIEYTSDWREKWNIKNDLTAADLKGVSVLSSDRWIVGGNSEDTGKAFLTINAGKTWNTKLNLDRAHYINDLKFYNQNFGIVATSSGIYISHDGGDSFEKINNISNETNGNPQFSSVDLVNDSLAWIAGSLEFIAGPGGSDWYYGAIYKTINSGESWTTIDFPDYHGINSVYFFDSTSGFITAGNKILKTPDGRKIWSTVFQASANFIKLDFLNNGIGLRVVSNGQVIKSTDSGDSWNYQNSSLPGDITDFKSLTSKQ